MEILEQKADRFYPDDYLLSRLRNRTAGYSAVIAGASAEAAWAKLLIEYRWVYFQMNMGMRLLFRPVFLYNEINTIILCIRNKTYKGGDIRHLLAYSLISKDMKEMFIVCPDIRSCIDGTEAFFSDLSPEFSGLSAAYSERGLTGFERLLRDSLLRYAATTSDIRIVRDFFVSIIDMRNILTLYKHIRWKLEDVPVFVRGGNISGADFKKASESKDIGMLVYLVTKKRVGTFDMAGLEIILIDRLTASIKKEIKDPLDRGNILYYLWRCYIETVNLGLIFYATGLGNDILEKELLR